MDVLRRIVMAVGGISVIALVAGLAAPKAVHAIVATAVQVVIHKFTQIPGQASQFLLTPAPHKSSARQ
jgi:hypothetical protein